MGQLLLSIHESIPEKLHWGEFWRKFKIEAYCREEEHPGLEKEVKDSAKKD